MAKKSLKKVRAQKRRANTEEAIKGIEHLFADLDPKLMKALSRSVYKFKKDYFRSIEKFNDKELNKIALDNIIFAIKILCQTGPEAK